MKQGDVIFKEVFGKDWQELPLVLQKHYANRAYSDDAVVMQGTMTIERNWFAKLLSPILYVIGALVPYDVRDIKTIVTARSRSNHIDYILDRHFQLPHGKIYQFKSNLVWQGGNEMIEFMRFGIGWRCAFIWDGTKVQLQHKGYAWRIGKYVISIPVTWFLGCGYAEEIPEDDTNFNMKMTLKHPWWGEVYRYYGRFMVQS